MQRLLSDNFFASVFGIMATIAIASLSAALWSTLP